jgi:hypothetical protein
MTLHMRDVTRVHVKLTHVYHVVHLKLTAGTPVYMT